MTKFQLPCLRVFLTAIIALYALFIIPPNIARAQNSVSIYSLGAFCDGSPHPIGTVYGSQAAAQMQFPHIGITSDNWMVSQFWETDAAAINQAAYDAINQSTVPSGGTSFGGSFLSKNEGYITIGLSPTGTANGTCLINTTLNFTLAKGRPIIFDARGATLICETGATITTLATPCLDMTGSIGMDIIGLTIVGSTASTPNIGILMGRNSDSNGSTYNKFEHLTFDGAFTFADFVNVAGEDTTIYDGVFANSANGMGTGTTPQVYGVVLDGQNMFYNCSTFNEVGTPPKPVCIGPNDVSASFNTFQCNQCKVLMAGNNAVPVWASNTRGHRWTGAYLRSTGTGKPPCIELNFSNGAHNIFDYFDAHCEGPTLGSIFEFDGQDYQGDPAVTAITINSLSFRDHTLNQMGSGTGSMITYAPIFLKGANVATVAITDAAIDVGSFLDTSSANWFANSASSYSISGVLSATNSTGFTLPATLNGWACLPSCTPYDTASTLTTAWLNTFNIGQITPPGSLQTLSPPTSPSFINYRQGFPVAVTISAPNLTRGMQATASIATYRLAGYGTPVSGSGGSGYSVGDTLTYGTGAGYTCSTAPTATVTTVSGTSVTGIAGTNTGVCSVWPATSTITGLDVSYDGSPVTSASGLTLNSPSYYALNINVTNGGTGYTSAPTATLPNGDILPAQLSQNPLFINGQMGFSASASSGLSQSAAILNTVATLWSAGLTPAWGTVLQTGSGGVYQEVNPTVGSMMPTCTTAAGDAPTFTSGIQSTADGCTWRYLSSNGTIPQLQLFDSAVLFPGCISLGVIDSTTLSPVTTCAGSGSPATKVTAPTGSLYTDASNGLFYQNANGTAAGWTQLARYQPQGTFMPSVTPATPGSWVATYATQTGYWSRVGQQVCVKENLVFTPTTTTGASGAMHFSLPAALSNDIDTGMAITNLGTLAFIPTSSAMPLMLGKANQSYAQLTFLASGTA